MQCKKTSTQVHDDENGIDDRSTLEIQNRQWTNIEGPLFDSFKPGKFVAVAPEWREGVRILMQAEVRSSVVGRGGDLMLLVRSNECTEGIGCRKCLAWQVVKGSFGADERRHCANGDQ
ncbi:uncharacterized protein N7479_011289 [Penicillium vulpinum]|uniref:uncharacterized protein n=1 Tax=Penicillium vulpinum TaxID=29845 RepID=UPI002546B524|nr:uncharacterized protein N7479_011289 [Penicillium vulpinum]KAJ5952876.1 hypothetical protein N7479_011289 [Penicillium vulpinum]